jgi:hypothetical protein
MNDRNERLEKALKECAASSQVAGQYEYSCEGKTQLLMAKQRTT